MNDYQYFGLTHSSSCEEILDKVSFFVEGDRYTIWKEWKNEGLEWSDFSQGHGIEIGTVQSRGYNYPVIVSFTYARIGDTLVAFYDCNSRCCDWTMIEDYITKNYPVKYDNGSRRAMTNSSNFHHCYHFCEGEFNSGYEEMLEKSVNYLFSKDNIKVEIRKGNVKVISDKYFFDKKFWVSVDFEKDTTKHDDNLKKICNAIQTQYIDMMARFESLKDRLESLKSDCKDIDELTTFALGIHYSNKKIEEGDYSGFEFKAGFEKCLQYITGS
jgi:hypothetical protein